ncbi:hypothetical protein BDV26DRAFT_297651 [Aspergillus bertholletiae]|uniref:NADH:flavin oxidoreductase/NADH oxidase N-terminal domain-containing protein n=1 Tax=Aspergillus bertholletiae TaxID=1226010 RepID=A0A5N7AS51_9EURO|nr:hypothetical protein BDV26DRAFT_297651 [Aspergillus bertholletiae]
MPSSTDPESISPDLLGRRLLFSFSGKWARNRLLKSSTAEYMASFSASDSGSRGIPSAELVNLYRRWGEGDIGVIITGNIMIDPQHLVSAGDPIIPINAPFEGLRFERFSKIALEAKRHRSLIIAQLCHPGRQTPVYLQPFPISASDIGVSGGRFGADFGKPREARREDISYIVEGFAHAAAYAERAGFDGIQLQAAHGHLLSQFLSPRTNKRQDDYGGSIKNRMKLISEIRKAISERVEETFTVGIKINAVEFQESAFNLEETAQLCIELEKMCFDFVELSGGTYEDWTMGRKQVASIPQHEGFFLEYGRFYSERMERTKVYVTGGYRSVKGMIRAVQEIDGIGLARPLCQEPHLCSHILSGSAEKTPPIKIDTDNFHLTSVAALMQMQHLGKGLQPVDLGSGRGTNRLYKAILDHERTRFSAAAPMDFL